MEDKFHTLTATKKPIFFKTYAEILGTIHNLSRGEIKLLTFLLSNYSCDSPIHILHNKEEISQLLGFKGYTIHNMISGLVKAGLLEKIPQSNIHVLLSKYGFNFPYDGMSFTIEIECPNC